MGDEEKITGHVIVAARELEQLMRMVGSGAVGIHDATTELKDRLSEKCVKNLRFIASVRNKMAHGEEAFFTEPDMERFDLACMEVKMELRLLLPPDTIKLDEVDSEFAAILRVRLRLCGFLPLLNTVYFIAMILRSLSSAYRAIILLCFFLIGCTVTVGGAVDQDRLRLFVGLGFFVLYWGLTLFYGISRRRVEPLIKWRFYSIPFLSAGYLATRVALLTGGKEFFFALLPLVVNCAGIYFLCANFYKYAMIAIGSAWIFGVIVVAMRKKLAF